MKWVTRSLDGYKLLKILVISNVRPVRSYTAHLVWDQRVAGSNPVSPTIFFNNLGSVLALCLIRHIFQQAHSKHRWDCCGLVLRRIGIGIGNGIGMELSKLRAVWTCCKLDATQSRHVAVIAGTQGEGGRAERCVIVTGYLRTKFFCK